MTLRNYRIGTRLMVGFGLVLALMLATLVASTWLDESSRRSLATALEAARAKESAAAELRAISLAQSALMRNVALHSEVKGMHEDEAQARKLGARFDQLLTKLAKEELSAAERAIVDDLVQVDKAIGGPLTEALAYATVFRAEEAAKVLMTEIDPLVRRTQAGLEKLIALQAAANQAAIAEANAQAARITALVYALALAVTLAALVLAWITTRSITRPLDDSVQVARRVSQGDLTARITVVGHDEPAQLLTALKEMNSGLGDIVQHIRTGSEAIAVGAGQVAAGNQQLSSRTEEHASSLEETASTLEEFTTAVRQNAEHARNASRLAAIASASAQRGGEVVGSVVDTMQEVRASSSQIGEIVSVIDGIAFQTNILALNAAVEAARAGEQGRGFAVVASEVRNLAQRSAASAKEIRTLIDASLGRVDAGAKLAENAGKTMQELVASVKEVASIMGEIAAASQEQTTGIEQINRAIAQMDHVVQMNASLVEEATAAAASMASQANDLAHSVARFTLNESAAPAIAAPSVQMPEPPRSEPKLRQAATRPALKVVNGESEWQEF